MIRVGDLTSSRQDICSGGLIQIEPDQHSFKPAHDGRPVALMWRVGNDLRRLITVAALKSRTGVFMIVDDFDFTARWSMFHKSAERWGALAIKMLPRSENFLRIDP